MSQAKVLRRFQHSLAPVNRTFFANLANLTSPRTQNIVLPQKLVRLRCSAKFCSTSRSPSQQARVEMSSGKASSALMRKRVASIIEASQDGSEETVESVTSKLLARHNEYNRYAKVRQFLAFWSLIFRSPAVRRLNCVAQSNHASQSSQSPPKQQLVHQLPRKQPHLQSLLSRNPIEAPQQPLPHVAD